MKKGYESKLKSFDSCINYDQVELGPIYKSAENYANTIHGLKVYLDKSGIKRNSEVINDDVLEKIARKMTNINVAEESRLSAGAVKKAFNEIRDNPKQKVLRLHLE